MTRRRSGEDLSDPVAEFEDGDADTPVVVAHFDLRQKVFELPLETAFELDAIEGGLHASSLPIEETVGAQLGGRMPHSDDEEDQEQGRRRRTAENLRNRLKERREEGLRPWLCELAEATRRTPDGLDLFAAEPVPGGVIHAHLRTSGAHVQLVATWRPTRDEGPGKVSVRTKVSYLSISARAYLETDGTLLDLELDFEDGRADPEDIDLTQSAPEAAAMRACLVPNVAGDVLVAQLETAGLIDHAPAALTLEQCLSEPDGAAPPHQRYRLDWVGDDTPVLHAVAPRAAVVPLEPLAWLCAFLAYIPEPVLPPLEAPASSA